MGSTDGGNGMAGSIGREQRRHGREQRRHGREQRRHGRTQAAVARMSCARLLVPSRVRLLRDGEKEEGGRAGAGAHRECEGHGSHAAQGRGSVEAPLAPARCGGCTGHRGDIDGVSAMASAAVATGSPEPSRGLWDVGAAAACEDVPTVAWRPRRRASPA